MQDDFYKSINGAWLNRTDIPEDKSGWGAFLELRDQTLPQLRAIVEDAARSSANVAGSEQQKIGDLFASFMDEPKREALGLTPLNDDFAKIAAISDNKQLPALIAYFSRIGVTVPYSIGIDQDAPGYDWTSYLAAAGVDGKVSYVVVRQPSYIQGYNDVLNTIPLSVWKNYFSWHLLSSYAPYLTKA